MNALRDYIDRHPAAERPKVREQIATAAGVKEPAVRHWANGTRGIPRRRIMAVAKAIGCDSAELLEADAAA